MANITSAKPSWQDVLKAEVLHPVIDSYKELTTHKQVATREERVEQAWMNVMVWSHTILQKQPDKNRPMDLVDPAKIKALYREAMCRAIRMTAQEKLKPEQDMANAYNIFQMAQEKLRQISIQPSKEHSIETTAVENNRYQLVGGQFSLTVDRAALLQKWIEDPTPLIPDLPIPTEEQPAQKV